MTTKRHQLGKCFLSASVLLVLASGCCLWPKRSQQAATQPAWTDSLREKSPTIRSFGLDSRAREIERNLGVE